MQTQHLYALELLLQTLLKNKLVSLLYHTGALFHDTTTGVPEIGVLIMHLLMPEL